MGRATKSVGGTMPTRVEHNIDDASKIIFVKIIGSIKDESEAMALAVELKKVQESRQERCWFVSDLTEFDAPSVSTASYFARITKELEEKRLGTISIVTSTLQKIGMKLLGTIRQSRTYQVGSMEEARELIAKLEGTK